MMILNKEIQHTLLQVFAGLGVGTFRVRKSLSLLLQKESVTALW